MRGTDLTVTDYDPQWAATFRVIRAAIEPVLAGVAVTVEHVGSTAVPGLAAKPIIDVDIVVDDASDVPTVLDRLVDLGYEPKGERGIEGREMLEPPADLPFHHPYVVVRGTKAHLDHVLLRDYLVANPDAATEYGAAKKENAHLLHSDRARYTDAKSDLVERMLVRARDFAGVEVTLGDAVGGISYSWRAAVDADAVDALVGEAFGGQPRLGWWRRVRARSLGWVTANDADALVGFVNVVTDGGDHAFVLDTVVASTHRRRGIGTELVRRAAGRARAADCQWLHVDFADELSGFYYGACGFRSTTAGLIRLAGDNDDDN